ncbi:NAD-dependent epimerase/dehydratase family protein [Actinophytocola gossypii]|uniref:NAD-dependent epimerase/dehydratase family protein n=1 Tax=Actinophytocola gossypii TaxID=2812003 RepID=A0ABT2J2X9_9PSEU|nr:NAD-dependent epimerase/dehydratase family protein [Actinophytocola gossypii]MCT2581959.1 NAD-dependent epimerase/dehydratase family protein [Actinophytocola gossypii]
MRVLLMGATGVLGRETVPTLLTEGHRVTGLASSVDRVAAVEALGATPAVADMFDVDALTAVCRGHDAVVNLATRIPVGRAMLRGRNWADNDRLRAEGSRTVAMAARAAGVGILVQEGVSLVYADGGDTQLDERARLDPAGPTVASVTAHVNAESFAGEGRTAVFLRIATLHGDDAISRWMLRGARRGGPAYFGDPDGWLTAIHPFDAASGVVAALAAPTGVYNLGATPVRKRDFGTVIAAAAGARRARSLPRPLTRGFLAILARSQRVSSAALTEATGWLPKRTEPSVDWFPAMS